MRGELTFARPQVTTREEQDREGSGRGEGYWQVWAAPRRASNETTEKGQGGGVRLLWGAR